MTEVINVKVRITDLLAVLLPDYTFVNPEELYTAKRNLGTSLWYALKLGHELPVRNEVLHELAVYYAERMRKTANERKLAEFAGEFNVPMDTLKELIASQKEEEEEA